ncbi:MAG: hypothetical protein FJW69_10465, partial [Actinobacteria bacterium]|nr:hypothetical protein [Actinomycetota bacterium]
RPARADRSAFFREHRLAVNDVRLAFELAAQRHGQALEWWPEPECHSRFPVWDPERRQDRRLFLGPDAYARYHGPDGAVAFFLEVDRGTEGHRRLVQKVQTYLLLSASGHYQSHYAPDGSKAFRVLFVVATGEQRLQNVQQVLAGQTERLVWLSLLSQVVGAPDVLSAPCWQRVGPPGRWTFLRPPPPSGAPDPAGAGNLIASAEPSPPRREEKVGIRHTP